MGTSKTSDARLFRWSLAVAASAVAVVLVAWLTGWIRFGTDPRVKEILALQEQARRQYSATGGPANLAEATAAFAVMTEIRQKTEALPEHLRPQVEQATGNAFQAVFRERIDRYFSLPPDQRQAELDRQIDQQEMFRKAMEAGRSVMNAIGGGGQATSQPAASQPWSNRSEDERNRWRKSMIDRTSPQERARFSEYIRALDARREKRGLPSGWPR